MGTKPIDPEQLAFMRVPVKCIPTVIAALVAAGFPAEARAVEEFTRDYTDPELNEEREKWIERAGGKDGEFEFDSDATISHSDDDGQYVLGWIWVYGPDEDDEDEDSIHEPEGDDGDEPAGQDSAVPEGGAATEDAHGPGEEVSPRPR